MCWICGNSGILDNVEKPCLKGQVIELAHASLECPGSQGKQVQVKRKETRGQHGSITIF
jgi:hypothetical protein